MRNVVATVLQVTAVALVAVGLWDLSPFLAGGAVAGGAGWVLAPDRKP